MPVGFLAADGAPGLFRRLLVLGFLAGYHTHFHIPLAAGIHLPTGLAGLCGLALLCLNISRVRLQEVVFVACLVGLAIASWLLNPFFWEGGGERYAERLMLSFLVMLYTVLACIGVLVEIVHWRLRDVAALFGLALGLLAAGIVLELTTALRDLSDAARALMFPEALRYADDRRDLFLYGQVRPRFFTAEPSYVGHSYALLLLGWFCASRRTGRWLLGIGLWVLGLMLVRSPTLVAVLPAAIAYELCRASDTRNFALGTALMLLGAVLATPLLSLLLLELMGGRLDILLAGQDWSTFQRLVLPLRIFDEIAADYPWFGLGFGAKEGGVPYAVAVVLQNPWFDYVRIEDSASPLGNNGLGLLLVQMGILGSFAFLALLFAYGAGLAGRFRLFLVVGVLASMLNGGGVVDLRTWAPIIVVIAIAAVSDRAARAPVRYVEARQLRPPHFQP